MIINLYVLFADRTQSDMPESIRSKSSDDLSVEIGIGDARRSDRLHVVDLLCSVGKRCSGDVVDISESGVCVQYTGVKRYQENDQMGLALQRHDVLLLVRAKVIWTRESGFNVNIAGFEFEDLKPGDLATIRELLSQPDKIVNIPKTA